MRRFLSILCKPVVLLALFFAWLCLFYWLGDIRSWSKYQCDTNIILEHASGGYRWARIQQVSVDGRKIIINVEENHSLMTPGLDTQVWETKTGKNITPDQDGKPKPSGELAGIWLHTDEVACRAFPQYAAQLRARMLAKWNEKFEIDDSSIDLIPMVCGSSPDGRYFYYGTDNGIACYSGEPPLELIMNVNSVAVDDVLTGKRIALLPGMAKDWSQYLVGDWLAISPDGRTAVSANWRTKKAEQPSRLVMWDLTTSRIRAELLVDVQLWGADDHLVIRFSDDSRFVFACVQDQQTYWWETSGGRRHGHVADGTDMAVLVDGRALVTNADEVHYANDNDNVGIRSNKLTFWDSESALPIGIMQPLHGARGETGEWHLVSPGVGPHFVVEFDYNETLPVPAPKRNRLMKFLFPHDVVKDSSEVLLIDGIQRREVAYLPGRTAAFSPNGRWLATIDGNGIVRVWELPLRRPWLRIVGYAAIATLACTLLYLLVRWPFRRMSA